MAKLYIAESVHKALLDLQDMETPEAPGGAILANNGSRGKGKAKGCSNLSLLLCG